MNDNGSKSSPVRTLIVKNFSVIKDARLNFGKITVLIGPQASGKSLLCKLAYFLGFILPEIASESAAYGRSWQQFLSMAEDQFTRRFPKNGWGREAFSIVFVSGEYRVEVGANFEDANKPLAITFSTRFERLFLENADPGLGGSENADDRVGKDIRRFFRSYEIHRKTNLLLGNERIEAFAYVPAGRSFFANLNTAFALFQNENLDQHLREFAGSLEWAMPIGEKPESQSLLAALMKEVEAIQGGAVRIGEGPPTFAAKDGRELPLALTSSGTQEIVPLLMLLTRLVDDLSGGPLKKRTRRTRDHFLFVEEPEAHIFPETQYKLLELFSWLSNEPDLGFSWAITTHSPYTLSSFNNLILAGQLGHDARLRKKIKIDPRFWVEPGTFRAYSIHDGKLESILSDSGLINGEYLDSVSETIGNEFDELLRLEYGKKKAS